MDAAELLLGIDGGGTKTACWLARATDGGQAEILGRGWAGAANPQSVGFDRAFASLDAAVAAAFSDAGLAAGPVAAAVLALAGSDRDENRQRLVDWNDRTGLARRFQVVHDALPVLAAGSAEGWGVALISGTGSLAFGLGRDGRQTRAGGWGYLFGDEGSGYWMATAALRAVAQAADGRASPTALSSMFTARFGVEAPFQLIAAVYPMASDRGRLGELAELVVEAATAGDAVAQRIVEQAAGDLAAMVAAVAERLGFGCEPFPLALAGGVLLNAPSMRSHLAAALASRGLSAAPTVLVPEPVAGAVVLAARLAQKGQP